MATSQVLSADTVAGAYPPPPGVSLGEATNFCFSPPQKVSPTCLRSKYLAFLAPYFYPCKSHDSMSVAERQLCVLDLQIFWDHIDTFTLPREGEGNAARLPSTSYENRTFAFQHVQPLLCPTAPRDSPLSPPDSQQSSSVESTPSSTQSSFTLHSSPKQNHSPITPLCERLRRERQRINLSHNGMTQFSWTISSSSQHNDTFLRILVPFQNSLYIQDGVPKWTRNPTTHQHHYEHNTTLSLLNREEENSDHPPFILNPSSTHWMEIYNSLQNSQTRKVVVVTSCKENQQDAAASSPLLHRKRLCPESSTTNPSNVQKKKTENNNSCKIESMDQSAIDPQLSPDGSMVAFVIRGDLYVLSCHFDVDKKYPSVRQLPVQVTFGAIHDFQGTFEESCQVRIQALHNRETIPCGQNGGKRYGHAITHGLADFVAQEEMERYRGFWWDPNSKGILFTRLDESYIPPLRIMHHIGEEHESPPMTMEPKYEEHRYPFAGEANAHVTLGYVPIDTELVHGGIQGKSFRDNFDRIQWFLPPDDSYEYLSSVQWFKDGLAIVQWQNRAQTCLLVNLLNVYTGVSIRLCQETSAYWINLNHMFTILPRPINPTKYHNKTTFEHEWNECPDGSFSFLIASERTGFCHLYLYTYIPGNESAALVRPVTSGDWIVESIDGLDVENNVVYVSGTYDSALEKHLYAVALLDPDFDHKDVRAEEDTQPRYHFWQALSSFGSSSNSSVCAPTLNIPRFPLRLTQGFGMHQISIDSTCQLVLDTHSDLNEPTSTKLFWLPSPSLFRIRKDSSSTDSIPWRLHPLWTVHDPSYEVAFHKSVDDKISLPPPEILSFSSTDSSCTLYAALYRPNPNIFGPGPYPLICSVYGGPRVQRVNRSWNQTIDLRCQRFCSLGFAVVKCDNRGSSRRGQLFEAAIKGQLGHIEVMDQAQCVKMLTTRGIADPSRVGIYGWSYGGYLATMCLCRAPDIFRVAVAGAPVSDWLGYDTHYTERYLGNPSENEDGYRKSSVLTHVQNIKGRLMIIHGLIDENVHWVHSVYLINQLTSEGKHYDLCIFPDERHSPRKLKNRIHLERQISDYFLENLNNMNARTSETSASPSMKPCGRL